MRQIVFFFIGIFILFPGTKAYSLTLSREAEISVMTCGPSELIHAIYGHTAIRVKDPQQQLDVIFNYGVFSFSAPNFVYRFAKGQTDYMLAIEYYHDFYEGYKRRGRSIEEQLLNLTEPEKQQLFDFLMDNARPENREYRYNFFFDNCASRVRDVIASEIDGEVIFSEKSGLNKTFREHVSSYQRVLPWTNFGIQLVLGSPADRVATAYQEMFLPDFLLKHFAEAQIITDEGSRPLVKQKKLIRDAGPKTNPGMKAYTPLTALLALLLLVVFISYRQYKTARSHYLIDYFLLLLTGLIGFGLLWFVFYSEHPAMHPNFNLLWAVPLNLVFLFLWPIKKWRRRIVWYWPALAVWMSLFLLFSFIVPQTFHPGFYLLSLMMLCRAWLHSSRFLSARKQELLKEK
ncbi:DUF4105 domain-containing protein [Gaoshiqia sp. Z1-71]|uniref:lipoprotein N-acyltransferase Lnb domain-containing protein n=1 Tax=Gaoshiqia hydrogeniformans TaxID=3290090 RepID=UPI003BF7E19A